MSTTRRRIRRRSKFSFLSISAIAALLLPGALLADSAFLGRVDLEVGTVETSREASMLTKTATLRIHNREAVAIENLRATLQPDAEGTYAIVDPVVEMEGVGAGAFLESEQTFAVRFTSYDSPRSVLLQWVLDFEVAGQPQQISKPVILDVPETD